MNNSYKILTERDIESTENCKQSFALHILNGLSQHPKKISSMYFYDNHGSDLFSKIMDTDEYYLTNSEKEILNSHKDEIAGLVSNEPFNLIEMGAGDGRKTNILLEHFLSKNLDFKYVPIDISKGAMETLTNNVKAKFPDIEMEGLVTDYFKGIKWLSQNQKRRNVVLFLGSTIGNFNKSEALVFLRNLWNALNNNDIVLIGFDLKKDIKTIINAYNDSENVTRDFNLNLLDRINKELGGNFNKDKFAFYANYNPISGAIESHLISLEGQSVYIEALEQNFTFEAWEAIHTEYSYKYLISDIERLATHTGYKIIQQLFDSKRFFTNSVWRAQKSSTKF